MKSRSDFFKANLIYFIILCLLVVVRIVSNLDLLNFMGEYGEYCLNFILQVGSMFVLPLLLFSVFKGQKPKQTFKDFNFKPISFKAVLLCIAIGIIVFFLNLVVSTLFNAIISAFGYDPTTSGSAGLSSYPWWLFIISIIFTAILPGFCEEFTHRGLLLSGSRKLGMVKALAFSSLFFGLMHMNIEQFFYASLIGLLLGFMTMSTGSIIPSMIVHFMNNAISTYITFASYNNLWLGDFYNNITSVFQNGFFVALILTFVVLTISIVLLIALLYLLFKETKLRRVKNLTENIAKKELRNNLMEGIVEENVASEDNQEISYSKNIEISETKHSISLTIPAEEFSFPAKQIEKPNFKDSIFFYANIFLSVAVTIATFIWGIL